MTVARDRRMRLLSEAAAWLVIVGLLTLFVLGVIAVARVTL